MSPEQSIFFPQFTSPWHLIVPSQTMSPAHPIWCPPQMMSPAQSISSLQIICPMHQTSSYPAQISFPLHSIVRFLLQWMSPSRKMSPFAKYAAMAKNVAITLGCLFANNVTFTKDVAIARNTVVANQVTIAKNFLFTFEIFVSSGRFIRIPSLHREFSARLLGHHRLIERLESIIREAFGSHRIYILWQHKSPIGFQFCDMPPWSTGRKFWSLWPPRDGTFRFQPSRRFSGDFLFQEKASNRPTLLEIFRFLSVGYKSTNETLPGHFYFSLLAPISQRSLARV